MPKNSGLVDGVNLMKKSKGSIPMPYIVAAIFAIIVIVIIGYMFFTESNTSLNVFENAFCNAKCLEYCNLHKGEGWSNFMKGSKCALITCEDSKC